VIREEAEVNRSKRLNETVGEYQDASISK